MEREKYIHIIHLITCQACKKQYTGSTVTKFRARFNQYKSNLKLYGEGRRRFFQEKLIEHFLITAIMVHIRT